ncbi:MAG: serine/threonine protein kinase/Tfp pilus assembly protein PilF [Paraglaciecola sp.]
MTDHNQIPPEGDDLATQELHSAIYLANQSILAQRFTIIEPLGSGAQANVYHAFDQLLETDVAIKVIDTSLTDPSRLHVIRNEVLIARQLQHPNIIRVHDVFEDAGLVFFTMELVDGEALIHRLQNPISQTDFQLWSQQLLSALQACETSEIQHGDIKPDNILIDAKNNLRLIDFGIGQNQSDGQQTSGHVDYSAPEVIYAGKSSAQSEVFSAGKVLDLMLSSINAKKLSLSSHWWHVKQAKYIARLTHNDKFKRPKLSDAVTFYHSPAAKFRTVVMTLLIGLTIAVATVLMLRWIEPAATILPDKTIQMAIIHDGNSPLLSSLAELLELPLQTNPQLAMTSSYQAQNTVTNLALRPESRPQDRVSLATVLGLDVMLLLTVSSIEANDFLLRASMRTMPADISLVEITRKVNANSLGTDLTEFAGQLFQQLQNQLSQQISPTDTGALLPHLASLPDLMNTPQVAHDNLTQYAPQYPGGWFKAAEQAWQVGDIQTAEENLQSLFALDTINTYWALRGRLLQAEIQDDLHLAKQAISKLTETFPQRPDLLAKRAEVNEWADNIENAIADYQQALELTPNNGNLWFQLARLKIISGQTRSAIENELTRALVTYRQNKNPIGEGLVLNAFGVAYLRLAEYDMAEQYFYDALRNRDPATQPIERATTLANLANVVAINGQFEKATSALEEAASLLSNAGNISQQAHILDTLGFLHEEQGFYYKALAYYKQGLDIRASKNGSVEQAQSMSNVAFMHFLIGDFSLADIYWQQAKSLFSKNNEQLHLQKTLQNLAQLSLAKGDHRSATRYLVQVSAQLDASQQQELMINKLLYSYLNFAKGSLSPALNLLTQAKQIALQTDDNRALTELYLWHAEICLRTADWRCLAEQVENAKGTISSTMIEQNKLLSWLVFSQNAATSGFLSTEPVDFLREIESANLPVLTEMKILLDIQERLNLPLSSQSMKRLEEIVKPIFYQQYMNFLYLQSAQQPAQSALREQLISHPQYWRNHLYYRIFSDDKTQQQQQKLQQEWMNKLSEEQADAYRELYLER